MSKPCNGCPYSRQTPPGEANLRNQSVRRFIGQAIGPFLLPCHKVADIEGWPLDTGRPQCVGAAMYRDLIGVADKMPNSFIRIEGDPELVFTSPAEYLAYHEGLTIEQAEAALVATPPESMLLTELRSLRLRRVLK